MVELAPSDESGLFRMGFAGDTMNTAWYLRRLLDAAHDVDFMTAVGRDSVSDDMLEFLRDAGIGTDHVIRRSDATVGLYMIHLKEGERSFSYWRGQSAARSLAREPEPLAAALETAGIAFFSGITLAILPAADRTGLLEALRGFRARGGAVAFDPNLRPRLWPDTAVMRDAVMQAARVSDIVLPSFEDESGWFGDADPAATANRYAACGARLVIVKNGADDVLSLENGVAQWHSPERVATVVDTTAAGDSFNAGVLAAWVMGQPTNKAVATGCRLAARVVQARGALLEGAC